ncbi:hypothetical protein P691DRAFT_770961 [Macrolepiota fuliginosa MF-IS2]|uniref:Tat pathway signal sequence n=1 Tax=Macrolepiota fuliginosa MF-IS2 TaxID=1400762 RepID=A0A9P5XQI5_9AGAR|nr:hypothetical protein P691DRAFT_770961 [Macrolepiota fuliginosa MF-IS2]
MHEGLSTHSWTNVARVLPALGRTPVEECLLKHPTGYSELEQDEQEDTLKDTLSGFPTRSRILHQPRNIPRLAVLALSQTAVILVLLAVLGYQYCKIAKLKVGQHHTLYSPAQDIIEYEVKVFNEGFGEHTSIYQQGPSPEVDEAWEDMYQYGASWITESEARQLTNHSVHVPGDEEHYVIQMDVFHQLHCLNMLRKALYPEYYPIGNVSDHGVARKHWGHCIENLRQSLTCSVDIHPIVWQWVDRVQEIRVHGNIAHMCRNFDKVKEWAKQRTIPGVLDFTGIHKHEM